MANPTQPSADLNQIAAEVRRAIDDGDMELARETSKALDEFHPSTLEETKFSVSVLWEIQRKGLAEIMLDRYLKAFPDDTKAQLEQIAFFRQLGRSGEKALAKFKAADISDEFRVAEFWAGIERRDKAIEIYRGIIERHPANQEAHRALVYHLIGSVQLRAAREALDKTVKMIPRDLLDWETVCNQAIATDHKELFRIGAKEIEPRAMAGGPYQMIILISGHDHFGNHQKVIQLTRQCDMTPFPSDWYFTQLLIYADKHNLTDVKLEIARRVLALENPHPGLKWRCTTILKQPNGPGPALTGRSKFWSFVARLRR